MTALLIAFGFMICVMAGAWVAQRVSRNVGWVDVWWTYGTGVMGVGLALAPFEVISGRQVLVAALIAVWSARLGTHVAIRVKGADEDRRYQTLRETWAGNFQRRLFLFLQIQAVVSALLGVSIIAASHRPGDFGDTTDTLGGLILLVGIAGEALADAQLDRFKRLQVRSGQICDIGLWSWSRHPNYFFEWVCWLAYPVIAWGGGLAFWLALIAPAVMYLVLVHGSGIPPVEQQMARTRGAAFERYRARTSAFFPLPPRS